MLFACGFIVHADAGRANAPMTGATQLAVGGYHTCAVTASGGVQCWGWNRYGQLGTGTTADSPVAIDVAGLGSGVVAVTAGDTHSCALMSGGGVKCWGDNFQGQLGNGTLGGSLYAVDVVGLSGAIAIAAGNVHTCALTGAGGVKCWGNNYYGQLGNGGIGSGATVVDVTGLTSGVVAIAAGYHHMCALTASGGMKCWGANYGGQLGDGSATHAYTPIDVSGLASGVIAMGLGGRHSCAILTGGGVKCWGSNEVGQLGNGTTVDSFTPIDVTGLGSGASALALGTGHSCALASGGGVKCWGGNGGGQLGNGTTAQASQPVDVVGLSAGVSAIASSSSHTCALVAGGAVRCWGASNSGQLGNATVGHSSSPVDVLGLTGMVAIATGEDHACALTAGGAVKCWGRNNGGQIGNATIEDAFAPVDVTGLGSAVSAVKAGGYTTCAIDGAGGLKCWGWDPGSAAPRLLPVDVPGLASGVADVTLATGHACVLTTGGGVKCWGNNSYGQLGNGSTTSSPTPVDVTGLGSNVIAINAGQFHTCAVMVGGVVKCWGDNQWGQLGVGLGGIASTPVTVVALVDAAFTVDGGDAHTCVQTSGYTMKCWGANYYAQFGIGHTYQTLGIVTVPLSTGTLALTTGAFHSCQLGGGGTVRCWGLNEQGQVGIGTTDRAWLPAQVPGIAGATAVSATGYHTCALSGDGSVKCWGRNGNGQLGNGVGGYATTPQPVLVAFCGGFADVLAGDPFCANVEWNRNRLVTLGCAPGLFCAAMDASRLATAGFMNRLGAALTPVVAASQATPGALDPTFGVVVCATSDHSTGGQWRRAYLDGVVGALALADVGIAMRFVWSDDGGLSWSGVTFGGPHSGVARAGRWSNLHTLAHVDLPEGRNVRYGIELSRGGLPGTGTLSDSTCNLRVRIDNRNGPAPPF